MVRRSLTRGACLGYVGLLCWLLLSQRPLGRLETDPGAGPFLEAVSGLAHVVVFLPLAPLALAARWPAPDWFILLLSLLLAVGLESLQGLVPGRTTDIWDAAYNALGVALGAMGVWGFSRR